MKTGIAALLFACCLNVAVSLRADDGWEGIAALLGENFVTVESRDSEGRVQALGSGTIIPGNRVVTCYHAIGRSRELKLTFPDETSLEPTVILAHDEDSDLAILGFDPSVKIDGGLEIDTKVPEVGASIAAMGNPGGDPGYFVTGVVAALPRNIESGIVLPLEMPIEQGNSGGPVVGKNGKLVGIVALKDLCRPGIGYASPSSKISELLTKPNPIAYEKWIGKSVVSPALWIPENPDIWFQKGGCIQFRADHKHHVSPQVCLVNNHNEKSGFSITAEVKNVSGTNAGLAIPGERANTRMIWGLSAKDQVCLWEVHPDLLEFKRLFAVERPNPGEKPWVRLQVDLSEFHVGFYIDGNLVHRLSRAEESKGIEGIGLQVSYGAFADFRNFAILNADSKIERVAGLGFREEIAMLEERIAELEVQAAIGHEEECRDAILASMNSEAKGRISLTKCGLLMAKLMSPEVQPEVYLYQYHQLLSDVQAEVNKLEESDPESIAEVIRNVVFGQWGFETVHNNRYLSGPLLPEDIRRVFDDRKGSVLAMQAVVSDILREVGLTEVVATNCPGMVLCSEGDSEQVIHTCNGEYISLSSKMALSGHNHYLENIEKVTDRNFLLNWFRIQKNQIPEDEWAEHLLPYLRTLVALDSNDYHSDAELKLITLFDEEDTERRSSVLKGILVNDPGRLDRERIFRILKYIGFDLEAIVAGIQAVSKE